MMNKNTTDCCQCGRSDITKVPGRTEYPAEMNKADFPVGHVQVHAYQRIPMTGSEETGPHELGKFKAREPSVA